MQLKFTKKRVFFLFIQNSINLLQKSHNKVERLFGEVLFNFMIFNKFFIVVFVSGFYFYL